MAKRSRIRTSLWVPPAKKPYILRDLRERIKRYPGRCLFAANERGARCLQPPHKCHTIPQASVLDKLKDSKSGKVLELRWGVEQWRQLFIRSDEEHQVDLSDSTLFEPQPVGIGDASIGWFGCDVHDNEFHPTDNNELNIIDPTVRFLIAYRALLYMTDFIHLWAPIAADSHRWVSSLPKPAQYRWWRYSGTIRKLRTVLDSNVDRLGQAWYARDQSGTIDPNIVKGEVLSFRSKLRFAACLFYGENTTLTVFPSENDQHRMAILPLRDSTLDTYDAIEQLVKKITASEEHDSYGIDVISELLSNVPLGIAVASPESYQTLSDRERETIRGLVQSFSFADLLSATFADRPPLGKGRRG